MGYLDDQVSKQENKTTTPFSKKKKAPDTKVVKLNAELHYKLNLYKATRGAGVTITDLVNQAVIEYIENHEDVKKILNENN